MWTFINANKTKILGVLIVAISFIQANPLLKDLLSETAFAIVMFICGLCAVVFGYLNNPPKESP